jgi:hypothetical protein
MAETLLANPVIEDFVVTVEALPSGEETHPWVEPEGPLPEEVAADEQPADQTGPEDTGEAPVADRDDA